MQGRSTAAGGEVLVWDLAVRLFHWSLVSCVAVDLILEAGTRLHAYAGYAVFALLLFRLVWGFIGSPPARFVDFVRGPQAVLHYCASLRVGRPIRFLGHNPAGGWMILLLIAVLLFIAGTGALMETDRFWGNHALEEVHESAAALLYVLIPVHVLGVVVSSIAHGENLVTAMVTGRKRADH
jgi:cytochrome b